MSSVPSKLLLISILFFSTLLLLNLSSPSTTIKTQDSIEFQKSLKINLKLQDFYSNFIKSWELSSEAKLESKNFSHVSFGFNYFESSKMFNLRVYLPCPKPDFFQGSPLVGRCEGKYSEIFEPGPDVQEFYAGENLTFPLERLESGFFEVNNQSEYGMIQCPNKEKRAFLRNVFSPVVARRASESAEEMGKKYSKNNKTLTVIFLVLDSVSRQSFYRNLKKTVKILNQTASNSTSGYFVYDFLGNQIHGWRTKANMIPFLYGQSEDFALERLNEAKFEDLNEFLMENQQNKSIWTFFRDRGFVTMFLNDVVSNSLNQFSGTTIQADHHIGNFWSMSKAHFSYHQLSEEIQCIGSYFPHHYSLKYLKEFTENYKNFNKFAYVHINVAHEATATRLKLLDEDLKDFCRDLMENSNKSDLVLVLAADHGRFKAEQVTLEGMAERAIPAHFLLITKEMTERLGFQKNLKVNSKRLVSRFDWHKSLKALAFAPYSNLTENSTELKGILTEKPAVSLFHSQVSEERKCSDFGISESLCFDFRFQKVLTKMWKKNKRYKFFVNESLKNVNFYLKESEKVECFPVKLEKLNSIEALYVKPVTKTSVVHYLLHLELSFNLNLLVHGSYSSAEDFGNKHRVLFKFTSIEPNYIKVREDLENSHVLVVSKIWSYTRLDLIHPNDQPHKKSCLENRFFHYNYLLADQQEDCKITCEKQDLLCIPSKFLEKFVETQKEMFKNITRIGNLGSLEIIGDSLIIGRIEMCGKADSKAVRVCHCVNPSLLDDGETSVKYW